MKRWINHIILINQYKSVSCVELLSHSPAYYCTQQKVQHYRTIFFYLHLTGQTFTNVKNTLKIILIFIAFITNSTTFCDII